MLSGELLREAEMLVNQNIHPMIIIDGFRKACDAAIATLQVPVSSLFAHVRAIFSSFLFGSCGGLHVFHTQRLPLLLLSM